MSETIDRASIEEPVHQNIYPVCIEDQIQLWYECSEDASGITQDFPRMDVIASAFFQYRIGVLSDRVLDHDMFGASDEEIGLEVEDDI